MLKNKTFRRVAAVIFALSVWQIAAMIVDTEFLFPTPIDVILRLFTVWREDGFFIAISNSFLKIVSGFLLGLILGTALAIIAARFSVVEDLLWPFMITIKSVPVASFIVLALMLKLFHYSKQKPYKYYTITTHSPLPALITSTFCFHELDYSKYLI